MTTPADRHLLAVHRSEVAVSVELQTPEMTLNIGPQHPSTHGVLRLVANISGERVMSVQPVMGYMHRGYEKLAEVRTYAQITALVNRIDWVSGFANEVPFIIAAERLMGVEAPERAQYIRVILTEMYRIANHLIFLCAFPAELGAPTPLMYALRERERVLDLIEGLTGGRFHPNFNRIGGVKPAAGGGAKQKTVSQDLPKGFIEGTRRAMAAVRHVCDDLEGLVLGNEIVQQRTVGHRGAPGRGGDRVRRPAGPTCGPPGWPSTCARWRTTCPTTASTSTSSPCPTGTPTTAAGCASRRSASRPGSSSRPWIRSPPGRCRPRCPGSSRCPRGECYVRAENPKGEMGYHIVSGGGRRPYRVKIRSTSFCNLAVLPWLLEGALIPDIIAILGSLDFVLGDVDR